MARNDGIDRTTVRNVNLSETKIANTQRHNEREKDSYRNEDIVQERTVYNVHYQTPTGAYREMFAQMEASKTISTRGLKADAVSRPDKVRHPSDGRSGPADSSL